MIELRMRLRIGTRSGFFSLLFFLFFGSFFPPGEGELVLHPLPLSGEGGGEKGDPDVFFPSSVLDAI